MWKIRCILSIFVSLYNLFAVVVAQATSPEVDVAVLQRLRNLIDQQRDQIRTRDRELNAKSTEVENVSEVFMSHHSLSPP
jgi:hypothetical protein